MPENGHKVGIGWPSWRYPPDGGKGAVFQGPGDVPSGWLERPIRRLTAEELVAAGKAPTHHFVQTRSGLSIPRNTRMQRATPSVAVPETPGDA